MSQTQRIAGVAVLLAIIGGPVRADDAPKIEGKPVGEKPTGKRTFRMGFTGFVHDITLEAVTASRKFVRENGDILAHHIEGVPWAEALAGQPFPKAILEEWEGKKSATPPKGKVYLAISPGRGELKVADKAAPLPKELKGKAYDDPLVMKAYLSYCRRAIEFFKPDYLAIGIETNEIHDAGAKTWQAYVTLHKHVYAELKKEHPELPIFASWTLHNMFKKRGAMLENWKKLMPHNDLVAVSYYPFFVADKDRLAALDWMTEQFDEFKKPYAMVETNDAAERLPLPTAKVVIEGTPEKQEAYYRTLLGAGPEARTSRSSSASSTRTTTPCGTESRRPRRSCSSPGATAGCSTRRARLGRRTRSGRSTSIYHSRSRWSAIASASWRVVFLKGTLRGPRRYDRNGGAGPIAISAEYLETVIVRK